MIFELSPYPPNFKICLRRFLRYLQHTISHAFQWQHFFFIPLRLTPRLNKIDRIGCDDPRMHTAVRTFHCRMSYRGHLSGGGLENLALGGVVPDCHINTAQVDFPKVVYVPEKLLNQVDVSEQHTTAAVAGKSQIVQSLSVGMLPSVT